MSTFMHVESRRLYSWWWDSHISPKNSKWLQENLADMDLKVNAMIKLIEEDADSFARRAEMYYKKRPELMKFVEDFYRAYRALAERYDHATGALRHAHRTIAEAFPNHIPLALPDESPSVSLGAEIGPCTPEMPLPLCSLFDPDDLPKDALGGPGYFHTGSRNATYAEENESFSTKKGLKQLNEMFAPREVMTRVKLHEGKARKGLKFQEEEDGVSQSQFYELKILSEQGVKEKENARNEIKGLQEEVCLLSIENQKLKTQIDSESINLISSTSEVQNLRDEINKLLSEKEAAILRDQLSCEKIASMETKIFDADYEFGKLHEEIMWGVIILYNVQDQCISLEKKNQSLILELEKSNDLLEELERQLVENQDLLEQAVEEKDNAKNEIKCLNEQLSLVSNESQSFKVQLLSETKHLQSSRAEVQCMRVAMSKLESDKEAAILMNQLSQESISSLEAENFQAKDVIVKLHSENFMGVVKLCAAEEKYFALAEAYQSLKSELADRKSVLEEIQKLSVESQNLLEQEAKEKENIKNEIECFQAKVSKLSIENQNMKTQMVSKSKHLDASKTEIQNLRNAVSILECEREDAVFKNQLCLENMNSLESELFSAKDEIRELHEELLMGIVKLGSAEEHLFALDNANQNLNVEIEEKEKLLEALRISLQESEKQRVEDIEHCKMDLEEEKHQLEDVNYNLKEHILACDSNLKLLQDEFVSLKEINGKLEDQISFHLEDRKIHQQDINYLESEFLSAKDEIRKLHEEVLMGIVKLGSVGEQHFTLDNANQNLKLEIEEKEKLLDDLRIFLQESEKQRVEDIEHCKMDLEEEKHQLEDVNYSLKEHILACDSNLKLLQDETVSLKEINRKLKDEISFHLEDRKLCQQELDSVKVYRDELDLKHKGLIEQMEVASLNMESLEILIKELQCGCTELKEGCSKLEDENLLLCNKLQDMGRISEKNTVLESTLADAMEKIIVLEDSFESLITKDSTHVVKEAALFSQIKVISENVEKLLEKNTLLENSLVDANTELEVLRSDLKHFEKSNQFISEQNSDLLLQKDSLISQVDSMQYSLTNLEKKSAMLESNHLNLEKEKAASVAQITELEDALKTKKNEHESLIQSNKIHFLSLENQIHLLQKDKRFKENELEMLHQELMSYIIAVFILQKCLHDMKDSFRTEKQKLEYLIQSGEIQLGALERQINFMQEKTQVRDKEFEEQQQKYMNSMSDMKEKNFILLHECKKHSEASRCAGEIISQIQGCKLQLENENALLGDQNGRLVDGIDLLRKSLGINKKLMNSDGSNDVQTILEEINDLLIHISDANDENQLLHAELSVCHIFLEQNALEKDLLAKELVRRDGQLLVFQRDKDQLFKRCEKLWKVVNEKEQMNSSLKAELVSLCRLLSDLSEDFSNLRDEKSALEEENIVLLEEALALEHLCLFFSSSNAENRQYLKLSNDATGSLLAVKNVHERQIRESEEKLKVAEDENKRLKEDLLILLEELISQTIISEFDLFTARHFCEELILQVETGENILTMKSMELLKAYQKIQCAQVEVTELRTKLNSATDEVYKTKVMKSQLQEKIAGLLEGHACKDAEIIAAHEENRMLSKELNRMSGEFELLRKGEQYLSSELQKKMCELDRCEVEIANLLINIHVSAVNGAVLEDKMFDLALAFEGSDFSALVQQAALVEGITQRNEHILKLQKMLDDFEIENSKLKINWSSCLPLFFSFENRITDVENQAHQLANLHEVQYFPSTDRQEKHNETKEGDHSTTIAGALEMQNLVYKLKEIEKLMLHTYNQLKQERLLYAFNLESARREIEELKQVNSDKQVKQGNKNSAGKDGQLMKDIELDRVSNSNTLNRIESAESEDQMLKLWETAEVSNSHGIERAQDFKLDQHSSEIIAEKEVGVDKQEISKEMKQSQEDWNRRVIERLSMGAEKLSVLKMTAQNLRTNMASPGKKDRRRYSEHNAMQNKLKQIEDGIISLVDAHGKMMKKLEENSKVTNGEKMGWLDRRQVWEQVQMIMDEIEKLEVELQEMQHFLVKFDEEAIDNNRAQESDLMPKVLLRDYIKGWRVGQGRKRGRFCGCFKPKTQE